MKNSLFTQISCAVLAFLTASFFSLSPLYALTFDPAVSKITFTFDDARVSTYTKAAPILKDSGLKGLLYVTTKCVGMTKTPNTCHAANDVSYMSWAQVTDLQNTYGWEIGSHSVTHPYLASKNASDGQPKLLTTAQVEYEISQSKKDLTSHGINAQSFASPYGDYSMSTLQIIAKYYTSHRAFKDQNNNVYPYNDRLLNNLQVQYPVTLASVKAKVDEAIVKKTWLVLTFHDIMDKVSTDANKYQWGSADLTSLAQYVKQKQMQNVNVTEGLVAGTQNLLPPIVVNNRISNGWLAPETMAFVPSLGLIPSYLADSSTSLRASGIAKSAHLLSPKVPVTSLQTYVIKNYLSVQSITKGEIGYYVDEYDASGNWVSGQYKTRETSVYVENMNMTYQPTSPAVKSASLQVYITAGSNIKATLDKFEWFLVAGSPTTSTNLITNSGFEAGLTGGWTTDDSSAVKADTSGKGSGSSPASSVAFSKTAGTAHLFSPSIGVTPGRSYHFEHYLNITANTGSETGVYIDEYDKDGNWVSGQYKATSTTLGERTVQFDYTPTSLAVSSIKEQFIFYAPVNGSIRGYVDNTSCIPL